jgi:hypothetical protein
MSLSTNHTFSIRGAFPSDGKSIYKVPMEFEKLSSDRDATDYGIPSKPLP